MRINLVEPESIAADLDIQVGDELLEINGRRVHDQLEYRFHESNAAITLKVARNGAVVIYDIEKDEDEQVGLGFDDMRILACGNDCIFCFVDQNPEGLRKELYFRDGDFRLSFMYGNYTTMTNAGPAVLERIIRQRLSPMYISVHVTDFNVRKKLMGLKKDDFILEKIKLLHDNGIDMHTQIVLCPGINDGDILERTVEDLYKFRDHIISLALVPVGLTDHRFGLHELRKVDREYAGNLLDRAGQWQRRFRGELGRNFVYPSDEFFILAGRTIPPSKYYDGFPQIENGVGLVRNFIRSFKQQRRFFPKLLDASRKLTIVTAELPAGFIAAEIAPALRRIANLEVSLVVAANALYGSSVTVAGLLSGKCLSSALHGRRCGDLVLLPPEILNSTGVLLDDTTLEQLSDTVHTPVMMFDGKWKHVFEALNHPQRRHRQQPLLPILQPHFHLG